MRVLFTNSVIEMTQAEMRAAEIFDSEMYRKLIKARRDNPDFKIVVVEAKPKKPLVDHKAEMKKIFAVVDAKIEEAVNNIKAAS